MPKSPRPFSPARGSTSGRPLMVLLDVLGRRWSLRVLWELRETSHSFRALREACDDVSPSVLNARLSELRELGLVESGEHGYVLTDDARSLGALMVPLDAWANGWAARLTSRRKAE
ncbi:MAG TPA: helix-turn-helix domain-containing protein [Polyangiales bacterium]